MSIVKESFNALKKEFNDNFSMVKNDLNKLTSKPKHDMDVVFEGMSKYYLYTINEASLSLHFGQYVSKKMVKEMHDSGEDIHTKETLESLTKYQRLAKTMNMETKELSGLKEDWITSMTEKMNELMK